MGIKLLGVVGLAISMVACAGKKSSEGPKQEPEIDYASYCQESETDGSDLMGIIGGRTLGKGGVIARSVVNLLTFNEEGKMGTCTGTLLKGHMILTAAHCATGQIAVVFTNNLMCELGEIKKSGADTIRKASLVTRPDHFTDKDGTLSLDMARIDVGLLKYEGNLPAGYVELDFPSEAIQVGENEKVILAGFGRTYSSEQVSNPLLRVTALTGKNLDQVDKDLIVTDQTEKGVCQGDSGSAMFVVRNGELKIVGVTSAVVNPKDDNDQCRGYGLFVRPNNPSMGNWLKEKYQANRSY